MNEQRKAVYETAREQRTFYARNLLDQLEDAALPLDDACRCLGLVEVEVYAYDEDNEPLLARRVLGSDR